MPLAAGAATTVNGSVVAGSGVAEGRQLFGETSVVTDQDAVILDHLAGPVPDHDSDRGRSRVSPRTTVDIDHELHPAGYYARGWLPE